MTASGLLAALAVALWLGPARASRRCEPALPRIPRRVSAEARPGAAALLGVSVALLVGGVRGSVAGLVTAVATSRWLSTLPARAAAERDRALRADLPMATELLAACLAAGASPAAALRAVASAVGGELGSVLGAASRRWSMTGSLAAAFADLPECHGHGPVQPLAGVFARVERGGGSAVPLLVACARELRDVRRTELDAAARRAGALAVAPLGLCFLPAFVLLGIVPLVGGLLGQVLPGT